MAYAHQIWVASQPSGKKSKIGEVFTKESYKKRMNWTVPWFSSFGSDFNYDFDVTDEDGEKPGVSVFLREGEDDVLHSYSTTGRGVDILLGTYNYLDLTPLGRQEEWEERVNKSIAPALG